MMGFLKRRRRERVRRQPFPQDWQAILERRVPYYSLLTETERSALHGHIQVFLDEKRFEGCRGMEVTDEVRLAIAAQACILLLNIDVDYFPRLKSVLVYSGDFIVEREERDEAGLVGAGPEVFVGESWDVGAVVFSWREVVRDARSFTERNVVFHEFAHQIELAHDSGNGWPAHLNAQLEKKWADVMSQEYEALVDAAQRRRRTFLDEYGAENPAEFFAVVTEIFFQLPRELQQRHPALYEALKSFYRQDPAERFV